MSFDDVPDGFKMSEIGLIPEDWISVQLTDGALFSFDNGIWKGTRPPLTICPVVRSTEFGDFGNLSVRDAKIVLIEEKNLEKKRLKWGDILIERSGGGPRQPVGRVAFADIINETVCFGNFLTRLRILDTEKVHPRFLHYFLLNFYLRGNTVRLQKRTTGLRNLAFQDYKKTVVCIPSLLEQQRVVAALSTVRDSKEKTEATVSALKELKKSMMKHLFTYGPISPSRSEEIRLANSEVGLIPESWRTVTLDDVALLMDYGTSKRCSEDPRGVPVLGIRNVVTGAIEPTGAKTLTPSESERTRHALKEGDLLFVRTNATRANLGKSAVYKGEPPGALFASYLIRVRVDSSVVLPDFVHLFTQADKGIIQLSGRASGAADGKFNINTQTLRSVCLPIPPMQTQIEMVCIAKAVDDTAAVIRKERAAKEVLFSAALHSLMTGKLRVDNLEAPT